MRGFLVVQIADRLRIQFVIDFPASASSESFQEVARDLHKQVRSDRSVVEHRRAVDYCPLARNKPFSFVASVLCCHLVAHRNDLCAVLELMMKYIPAKYLEHSWPNVNMKT